MVSGLGRLGFGRPVAVGVAAAMLLVGCGGKAPSNPTSSTTVRTPSTTPSATSSRSPSGTASTTPALRPSRWVVRPDGPFPLGGLVVAAGRLVIAQKGACCDDPPSAKFAAYDSVRRTWRLLPDHPGGGPSGPVAVWTGSQVVVFGEAVCPTCTASDAAPTRAVYSFNPARWAWWRLAPAPVALRIEYAVWTGREVLAVGEPLIGQYGYGDQALLRYSPSTDSWRIGAVPPGPSRTGSVAAWADGRLLVWGGMTLRTRGPDDWVWVSLRDGLSYDAGADRWTAIPAAPDGGATGAVGDWTGRELLVWGGWGTEGGGTRQVARSGGAAYNPSTRTWRTLAAAPLGIRRTLTGQTFFEGVGTWTGWELVVLVERAQAGTNRPLIGAAYDPARDTWRLLPDGSGLAIAAAAVWTGRSVALVGGYRVGDDTPESPFPHLVECVASR